MALENELFDIPSEHAQNVYGQFDAYLKKIERTIGVTVVSRDGGVKLIGNEAQVESAKQVLLELLELSRRGNEITGNFHHKHNNRNLRAKKGTSVKR